MDIYVIRCATSLDDLQWGIKQFAEIGFYCTKEADCYYAAGLTDSFFIGRLNGEWICCISVVKHRKNEAFGGYFFTAKPYSRQGYGRRVYDIATGTVGNQCNIQTNSLVHMKDWNLRRGTFLSSLDRKVVFIHSFTCC